MDDSLVSKGKESLLIPEHSQVLPSHEFVLFSFVHLLVLDFFFILLYPQVMDSSVLTRCPHRSEVQSVVLAETDSE